MTSAKEKQKAQHKGHSMDHITAGEGSVHLTSLHELE
jgi:hypothetical protein